jgi:hypothetical protein
MKLLKKDKWKYFRIAICKHYLINFQKQRKQKHNKLKELYQNKELLHSKGNNKRDRQVIECKECQQTVHLTKY